MGKLLALYEFTEQSFGYLVARFFFETVVAILVIWIFALILLHFTKGKEKNKQIGFTNWFKICFMYGIVVAKVLLGIIVILTIRENGLYYFYRDALSWSWYCGYLLMTPEILLMICLVVIFFVLDNKVKQSIK